MKTQQERQADKREGKLADVQRQVKAGTLVIRQMTPDERERNPPQARPARRR
jgi:hypothetical protein